MCIRDRFAYATAFNQDLGGWAVDSVTDMSGMFFGASAFDQDLGWCVDDDVDLTYAFSGTQCASTSCGVVQNAAGTCAPTPAPTISPAPTGWFSSSSQKSNEDDAKMMTLVVLAGLLGLSLAIAAGLFALRQQQLAAKKPRAPRTFTVTAVQGV